MKETTKGKSLVKLLILLAFTALFLVLGISNMKNIKLGLDLAGGVSITYQTVDPNPDQQDMADTIYKLQKRAEGFSAESAVYQEGSDRINIDIPGASNADEVLEKLGQPGSLVFYEMVAVPTETGTEDAAAEDAASESGDAETQETQTDAEAEAAEEELQVSYDLNKVLDGSQVKMAGVTKTEGKNGEADSYEVVVAFTDEGSKAFAEATERNVGQPIYIEYDGEIISYPIVQQAITGGQCSITGNFTYDEAYELAQIIRLGALKLDLTEIRSNVVGARLGEQAIQTSILAGIIGFAVVVLLMLALYRVAGLAASLALSMYVGLMLIMLDAFEVTLTLPGIAGMILSIGMAVDANVIIFTRIKEEIGVGKSSGEAIHGGFHKALSAIVDGNVTTIIAAIVLYLKGSGTVKGFAQTLAIGIVLSMVTALFITRWYIESFYGLGCSNVKCYGSKKPVEKPFDFIGKRKITYSISAAVIVIGLVFALVNAAGSGKGLFNYGIDFAGGTSTTVTFNENMSMADIDGKVNPVVVEATGDMSPQSSKVEGTNEVIIRTRSLDQTEREKLNTALADTFGVDKELITAENISGTISSEMKADAIIATLIATVLMLLYIWLRFKNIRYAGSSVLALCHDVLVTVAFYAIFRWSVGSTFIACILTIVGYSINATIVIFDRIRENRPNLMGMDLKDVVNLSITETFSRSIFTSLTTFVMVLCLFILGVSSIREFALPLMVGIVAGCFSSVCITGPMLYGFTKNHETKLDEKKAAEAQAVRNRKRAKLQKPAD